MSFKPDCDSKIEALCQRPKVLQDILECMEEEMSENGQPSCTLVIPLYDEHSGLESGDLAPEIHMVVRRVK